MARGGGGEMEWRRGEKGGEEGNRNWRENAENNGGIGGGVGRRGCVQGGQYTLAKLQG